MTVNAALATIVTNPSLTVKSIVTSLSLCRLITHARICKSFTMKFLSILLMAALCGSAGASAAGASAAGLAFLTAASSLALQPCPPGSQNCILTTWTPPARTNKATIASTVMAAVREYPAAGQAGIDKGGYEVVEDALRSKGTARIEYRNNGIWSKLFNGGSPFVDDLVIQLEGSQVQVKSSSRIGKSDLGVNQKRLQFFAKKLREKGWTIPEPSYK